MVEHLWSWFLGTWVKPEFSNNSNGEGRCRISSDNSCFYREKELNTGKAMYDGPWYIVSNSGTIYRMWWLFCFVLYSSHWKVASVFPPLELEICENLKNIAKATPHLFLSPGFMKLAAFTSCLLAYLLLEPSHHAVTNYKLPMERSR